MFQHEKLLVDYHLLECVSVCSHFRFRSSSWESEKRVQKNRENAHKFTRCGTQKPLRRSLLHNFHTKKLNVLHRETARRERNSKLSVVEVRVCSLHIIIRRKTQPTRTSPARESFCVSAIKLCGKMAVLWILESFFVVFCFFSIASSSSAMWNLSFLHNMHSGMHADISCIVRRKQSSTLAEHGTELRIHYCVWL